MNHLGHVISGIRINQEHFQSLIMGYNAEFVVSGFVKTGLQCRFMYRQGCLNSRQINHYSRLRLIELPWDRLALLSQVIYVMLQIRTAKGGSIKRRELLTGELLNKVYCI